MNKRILSLALALTLILVVLLPASNAAISNPPGPYEYVVATIAAPRTVDPAYAYDTASGELIFNVYETLITFDKAKTDAFSPLLADSWAVSPDGTTYSFHIRTGAQWHNPAYGTVTPADVEYSLERVMVRDFVGGPAWMLWEPTYGVYGADDFGDLTNPAIALDVGLKIDAAVTSNATHVEIHFFTGKPYAVFPTILSQTWCSILSKQWCIDNGDWNPATAPLNDGGASGWVSAHAPATSPLDNPNHIMMGSGPFKFDYWIYTAWSLVKFDNYWGGWGNPRRGYASRGYLTRFTELFISDWPTRLAGFTGIAPIYDSIYVPRSYISQVWQQPGVRCIYPLTKVSVDAMFFTYDTGPNSPYIGNGQLGELGIIPTFFSDTHVRKAMAYSFNWTQYISAVFLGEATQYPIPVPDSFKFFNVTGLINYGIDVNKAKSQWAQAWTSVNPGGVMATGMSFTIVYPAESTARQAAANMLATQLNNENPLFHVLTLGLPWATYLDQMHSPLNGGRSIMPTFIGGWQADFPDVHDFVGQFMASWGYFAGAQSIDMDPFSAIIDEYIDWGFRNTTDAGRAYNYNQLYELYVQQVPSVPLVQELGRRWARDWVHGWYYNPIYPGTYAYSMWKEELPWEDITEDGKVEIKDLVAAAMANGSYFLQPLLPPNPLAPGVVVADVTSSKTVVGQGFSTSINVTVRNIGTAGSYTSNWDSRADLNVVNVGTGARGDMKVDDADLAAMAKMSGYVAPPWVPPPSIRDASVTDVTSSKTVVGQGFSTSTKVLVGDQSVLAETFNVNVYADLNVPPIGDEILIGTQTVADLLLAETRTFIITWNTTGVPKGNYTISAVADITGSSFSDGTVTIAMVGDISGPTPGVPDGKCDVRDLAAIAKHYGHLTPDEHAPGTPDYIMCFNSDISGPTVGVPDGKVDIRDLAAAAKNFGKIDP